MEPPSHALTESTMSPKDKLTVIWVGCRQKHAVHLPHLFYLVGDLIDESSNFLHLNQPINN